jgi:hypothetical protein
LGKRGKGKLTCDFSYRVHTTINPKREAWKIIFQAFAPKNHHFTDGNHPFQNLDLSCTFWSSRLNCRGSPRIIGIAPGADWLQAMEEKHGIMSFRQDLYGFGEPMEGHWDGFQRINTDKKNGGIIAVFRHGATENKRLLTVRYLDPFATYEVRFMDGKVLTTLTGEQLKTNGFELSLKEMYAGELFEIIKK